MYHIGDKIVHPMHGAGINDSAEIGVRDVVCEEAAEKLLQAMATIEVEVTQNWNRRYRENMLRIKSGDLLEVARVVKSLMARDRDKGLSTGERKMLHSAKQILISELVMSINSSYDEIEGRINAVLA